MNFNNPQSFFLLLLLPPLWMWMRSAKSAPQICVTLKCIVFACLVIALTGPSISTRAVKLAVTVVMDTSASMPRESLQRGQSMFRDLVRQNSGAEMRLITFAGGPKLWPVPTNPARVTIPLGVNADDAVDTDLESALGLALNTFPTQGARRVLLISDANETRGNALTAALRARANAVSIFTVPSGEARRCR